MITLVSPNFGDLLESNIEIGSFPDGDSHVRIPQIGSCKGSDVTVFHRLYPKQNTGLITLLLILDGLKEAGAKSVSVVVPYMPYARQDKKKLNGEVASAFTICGLLARAGVMKLVTFDCHFLNHTGPAEFGGLSIENISMGRELVEYARAHAFKGEEFDIVSPDAGSNYLVAEHGGKSFKKVRHEYDGETIDYRRIRSMDRDFDVARRNVLLLDDMVSTGSTMITALEKLTEAGAAKICCAAVHGLFLFNCMDKIRKYTDCAYSTDTIEGDHAKVSIKDKLAALAQAS